MKIQKTLQKLMGIHFEPTVLVSLEKIGFKDTGDVEGDYMVLQYRNHKVLYDKNKDQIIDWYTKERRK